VLTVVIMLRCSAEREVIEINVHIQSSSHANELLNQHDNVLNSFLYITANELGRAVLVASVTIGLGSMASDSKPTLEPAGSLPHISREGTGLTYGLLGMALSPSY